MKSYVKTVCLAWLLITGSATVNITNASIRNEIKIETAPFSDTVSIELLHAKKNSTHLVSDRKSNRIIFTNSLHNHPLEFYVFDLEGTLIHHTILNPNDKKNSIELYKGTFLYDLFYKDESIERGQIIIK